MSIDDVAGALVAREREPRAPGVAPAALAALFVAGLVGWAYVMGWGRVPLDFHDWTDINVPRLLFLQNALRAGEWPLHMGDAAALHGVTDRFLALPDVMTAPPALLLLVLDVPTFVLVDVLIAYAAGFAGLILLRRYFGWSVLTAAAVFLLFLFNGHILSHYSVGHFTWASYFLFPYVFLLIARFLDGDDSWRSVALFALLMFYMVLAGGQHHMTWVLILLGLLIPFCWKRAWWLIAVGAASGLLSAVRLLPPALEIEAFRNAGLVSDVLGYPSLSHLLTSLVVLRREIPAYSPALPGNMWFFDSAYFEFSSYVGGLGFALIVFGLYRWLRTPSPAYAQLIVPIFAMSAMSLGSVYRVVRMTQIPLLESERYTSRLFSLPLTFMIVLAATAIDRWMKDAALSAWQRALAFLVLLFVAIDISSSLRLWRVAVSSGVFGPTTMGTAATLVGNRADPAYTTTILIGLAITGATAAALLVLSMREDYRARPVARAQTI